MLGRGERSRRSCVLIYITDKDEAANEQLRRDMENAVYNLLRGPAGRPDLENNRKPQLDCYASQLCSWPSADLLFS
jgi:hypothetical protein